MAGGFLEGVIRLYTEKGWQFKHLIFFVFAVIAMFPDTLKTFITKDNVNLELLGTIVILNLLVFVLGICFSLFILHFTHNSIKYFQKLMVAENKQMLKKVPIVPRFDGSLFKHFGAFACFSIVWWLLLIVISVVVVIFGMIPIIGVIPVLCFTVVVSFALPYINARFAENYQTRGNLNPALLFSIFPEIWKPTLLLMLKCVGVFLCIALVLILPYYIAVAMMSPSDVVWLKYAGGVFLTYIGYVITLVYSYSIAYIYCTNDI